MTISKYNVIKIAAVVILCVLYFAIRYYQSFYLDGEGYASGDAYSVILNAYMAGEDKSDIYMVSYFYKISYFFE